MTPGADVGSIAHELAALQLWLHAVPPPAGLPLLRDRLATRIREVIDLDGSSHRGVLERLSELESGAALCHGDLHPGNIILTDTGPAIVDWFDAAVGSALADVVRTSLLIRPQRRRDPPVHLPGATNALLAGFHTAFLRRHLDLGGIDAASWRRWEEAVATARLSEPACRTGVETSTGEIPAAP